MNNINVPLCITRFECMCSKALQIWRKYFQIVLEQNLLKLIIKNKFNIDSMNINLGVLNIYYLSGMSLFCFLKCLIILERSPASANSSTMFSSLASMNEAK